MADELQLRSGVPTRVIKAHTKEKHLTIHPLYALDMYEVDGHVLLSAAELPEPHLPCFPIFTTPSGLPTNWNSEPQASQSNLWTPSTAVAQAMCAPANSQHRFQRKIHLGEREWRGAPLWIAKDHGIDGVLPLCFGCLDDNRVTQGPRSALFSDFKALTPGLACLKAESKA